MAFSIRRAFRSYSYLTLLLRSTTSVPCRHASYMSGFSRFKGCPVPYSVNSCALSSNFIHETRRGFAKGRRQMKYEEDDDEEEEGNTMPRQKVGSDAKTTAQSQMDAAIDALSRELSKLRTGRASAGMLDHIIVETSGVKMPLSRMAVVSVMDSSTLSVTPYDPNTLKELEKAIVSSPLGLNPKEGDQRLIATIPPLTKEHMQAVCKIVAKASEDAKQSIRRARQKALDSIKKAMPKKKDKDRSGSVFSEDDAKRMEKEVDELTKKFIKSAEDMCKAKEKEINGG